MTNADITAMLKRYTESHETSIRDRLITLFSRRAINHARTLTIGAHGYAREEVKSFALEALWVALETFDVRKGTNFNTHLRWTVKRYVLDGLRTLNATRRTRAVLCATDFTISLEREATEVHRMEMDVFDQLQIKKDRRPCLSDIRDMLDRVLPLMQESYQRLIVDVYFAGLTQTQVAQREGLTTGAITLRKNSAMAEMRALIKRCGGGWEEYERGTR